MPFLQYEAQRHVVMELESLLPITFFPSAGSSCDAASRPSPAYLPPTARSVAEIVLALRNEGSWRLAPFGHDLASIQCGTVLSGCEIFRRLICLRFEVDYTTLPLGAKKLTAFAVDACEREAQAMVDRGIYTSETRTESLARSVYQAAAPRQLSCGLARRGRGVCPCPIGGGSYKLGPSGSALVYTARTNAHIGCVVGVSEVWQARPAIPTFGAHEFDVGEALLHTWR